MFRRIPPSSLALLIFSIVAALGAGAFFATKPARPSGKDPEAIKLRASRDALMAFSDQFIAELEVRKQQAHGRLPSQTQVSRVMDDLKENWTVQSIGKADTKMVPTKRYMLTNINQRFRGGNDRQWTDIVSTVKSLDARPGFVIQSIVISSSVKQGITYGQVIITVAACTNEEMPSTAPSA